MSATEPAPLPGTAGQPRIWAVGGGKGGVGKSFIAANLGLALGKQGKRVVLVDLDLGSANLHTCLGMSGSGRTLSDYLTGEISDINDLVSKTEVDHIGMISGAADNLQIANLKHFQKAKLLRNLKNINADYVILDLGAGTGFNTLDFFVQADRGLISVTPDPTSIENTYRFLKCVFMRKLHSAPPETKMLMNKVLTQRQQDGEKTRSLAAFLSIMDGLHPEYAPELRDSLASLQLHLIVNQVLEPRDTELGHAMQMTCNKYFASEVDYLGYLHHDKLVLQSLRQRNPFITAYPQSRNAVHMEHMASSLISLDEN
ncbi:MAG: AAA family ATPase [Mariprofundaceae bacterium]|nr:AAA family ATPase [Mariprofundaceae bacterium]